MNCNFEKYKKELLELERTRDSNDNDILNDRYNFDQHYNGSYIYSEELVTWTEKEAEKGNSWAQYMMGWLYSKKSNALGITDVVKSKIYYYMSSEQGNSYSEVSLFYELNDTKMIIGSLVKEFEKNKQLKKTIHFMKIEKIVNYFLIQDLTNIVLLYCDNN